MTTVLNRQLVAPALDFSSVKRAFGALTTAFKHWTAARQSARRDAEYWALAQTDSRVMAEIWRAMCTQERDPR